MMGAIAPKIVLLFVPQFPEALEDDLLLGGGDQLLGLDDGVGVQ